MKKTAVYQRKRGSDPAWYNTWIQSPRWLAGFGIVFLISASTYGANAIWGTLHPGSPWGLAYGAVALGLFFMLALYGLRRRTRRVKGLHRSWYFLQFHVYGGVFFLLLVLMHSNFSLPQGIVTWWLWALSLWIVVSGLLGNVIQKWIPAKLNSSLTTEVNYNRIPELMDAIKKRATACVAAAGEEVRSFFSEHVEALLAVPRPRWIYFLDTAGALQRFNQPFTLRKKYLSNLDKEHLDELERLLLAKLELDAHFTLQRALRWWLYVHVPVAVILVALIAAHLFAVFYY